MRPIVQEISSALSPETLAGVLRPEAGVVLLRSGLVDELRGRYSFVTARPFLTFRSYGSRILVSSDRGRDEYYGNPWHVLDQLMASFEVLDELDLPFPLGGCFGFWGYDLKNFVEPKLKRTAPNDLELPDCCVGFYASLVVFDHQLAKIWVVSSGLTVAGTRDGEIARHELAWWEGKLACPPREPDPSILSTSSPVESNLTREEFISRVRIAQDYIRNGHIYQVNLSQRLSSAWLNSGWMLFERLRDISPAPYSAYLHCGDFEICSSSPEMFLRMSGSQIQTRPIKGTRPRGENPTRDAQLAYELQTSAKEVSELVMITDLLRNDLGRVCEYGSIQVPDLVHLERFAQVQHLVSTVEGRLRSGVTHFAAFSSCFPGGSISGAPKIRAMEIIDELETVSRGPYTGALGYLGFNRESQLSIVIRTALCRDGQAYFNVGAGIVADSSPEAEYDETLAKAAGFLSVINSSPSATRPTRISRAAHAS